MVLIPETEFKEYIYIFWGLASSSIDNFDHFLHLFSTYICILKSVIITIKNKGKSKGSHATK